jgi:hypothetical protein
MLMLFNALYPHFSTLALQGFASRLGVFGVPVVWGFTGSDKVLLLGVGFVSLFSKASEACI